MESYGWKRDADGSLDPDEYERIRRLLDRLPRDGSGLSPLLVGLADVLPPEIFEVEGLQ